VTFLARWREPPPARRNDVAVYDERADAWWNDDDSYFAALRAMVRPRLSFFARHALPLAGARVLDAGAGGGLLSVELAARGARVVALDLGPRALRAARAEAGRRGLTLAAVVANGGRCPLKDASFDLVVCADVLPHVVDLPPLLDELARLVAPGGRLYVATMNRTALARFVLITLGEDVLGLIPRGTHVAEKFITPAELSRELASRGLTLAIIEGVGPSGFDRKGLTFGRIPSQAVMYQALFTL
jgi:2-polyprenyl-6-hydroxyphenyl methylase/3-demethylubiquinone-9 3-methyltransferase